MYRQYNIRMFGKLYKRENWINLPYAIRSDSEDLVIGFLEKMVVDWIDRSLAHTLLVKNNEIL